MTIVNKIPLIALAMCQLFQTAFVALVEVLQNLSHHSQLRPVCQTIFQNSSYLELPPHNTHTSKVSLNTPFAYNFLVCLLPPNTSHFTTTHT